MNSVCLSARSKRTYVSDARSTSVVVETGTQDRKVSVRRCLWTRRRSTRHRSHVSQHATTDIFAKVLAFVHQPVKALILCFPITAPLEEKRKEKGVALKVALDPPVIFIKQTVYPRVFFFPSESCFESAFSRFQTRVVLWLCSMRLQT
jgi:hypothetical protein